VIGDGLQTRFKYTQVQSDDFGLNNEEILLLDDKKTQLNRLAQEVPPLQGAEASERPHARQN